MDKNEIKSKIEALEQKKEKAKDTLSKSSSELTKKTIPALIEKLDKEIDELKSQLDKAEEPKKEEPKEKAKPEKKTGTKKKSAPKEPTPESKGTFEFDGKIVTPEDVDYCKKLIAASNKRIEDRRKSQKKYQTKPVFQKIASNIATSVKMAIDNVSTDDLKNKKASMIAKIKKLEESAKEFISSFKSVLGDDYDKSEADQELKVIHDMIEKLKKKYASK